MPNKNTRLTKYLWEFLGDDFYVNEYGGSCCDMGYSTFDKWEDGQFVEDNDLFFSLCEILSHFDEDNSDNQP